MNGSMIMIDGKFAQGLNDDLLEACGVPPDDCIVMAQAERESEAMSRLSDLVPDLATLLGPTCYDTLNSGGKLELESLIGFSEVTPCELAQALVTLKVP